MNWTRTTLTSVALLAALGCGGTDSGPSPGTGADAGAAREADAGASRASEGRATNEQPKPDAGRGSSADAAAEAQPEPSLSDVTHGWNEVRGAPVGRGDDSHDSLRNDVKPTVLGDLGYEAGRGWVMRSVADSDQTKLIIEVHNRGSEPHCFIQGSIVWKDAAGQVLTEDDSHLDGSTATDSDGDVLPASCLAPGELGYVYSLHTPRKNEPSLFDLVTNVEITFTHKDEHDFRRPAFKLAPVRYEVRPPGPNAIGSDDELFVTLKNVGTAPAPIQTSMIISYLLLDDSGLPVARRWLDVDEDLDLAPGATFVAHEELWFGGRSQRLLVHVYY